MKMTVLSKVEGWVGGWVVLVGLGVGGAVEVGVGVGAPVTFWPVWRATTEVALATGT